MKETARRTSVTPGASALVNPYAGCRGAWIPGNLHGHSSEWSGCASVPLLEGLAKYQAAGAAFCAVTDHDHVSDLSQARARWPEMTLLEGFEWSRSQNILFIGERVPDLFLRRLPEALRGADGLLTIVCHPQPTHGEQYWTVPMIMALAPAPVGIEVYNAHYGYSTSIFPNRNPLYTGIWDDLLTRGVRLWGFANDDSHDPRDFGHTRTMVCVEDRSPAALMRALRAGRFYGSTGLLMDDVGMTGTAVRVRLASEARGRFVGPGGTVLAEAEGKSFAYQWSGESYVRFEAEGAAGRIFLQPFFAD